MAIGIQNQSNIVAPGTTGYPDGDIRDRSGATNGTPVNRKVYADMHQFFAKLLRLAGISANNTPDNETNGFQYISALLKFIEKSFSKGVLDSYGNKKTVTNIYEIGSWDMQSNSSKVISGLPLIDFEKIVSVHAIIRDDTSGNGAQRFPIDYFKQGTPGEISGSIYIRQASGLLEINMGRVATGLFDSSFYNDTSINRGFVHITYYE